MQKVTDDDLCACGSGESYVSCCRNMRARWLKLDHGEIRRQFDMPKELVLALEENETEFEEIFGRKSSAGDKVLFSNFLTNSFQSGQDILDEIVCTGQKIGVKPATLYATKKTGTILAESNLATTPPGDLAEWQKAIDEYYEALGDGVDLLNDPHPIINKALDPMAKLAKHAPIHFGSYVDKIPKDRRLSTPEFCQALVLSRVHQLLVSFVNQIASDTREEVFMLIRALYECYLIMVYLEANDEHASALLAQGFVGNDQYKFKLRKDGLPDRRFIVETSTGREFPAHTSFYKMAEHSPISEDIEFFDVFYEGLSRHVHFSLSNMQRYFSSNAGFTVDKDTDFAKALIVGYAVVKMICDAVVRTSLSTLQVKRDARYLGKKIRFAVLEFLKAAKRSGAQIAPEIEIVRKRLKAEFR